MFAGKEMPERVDCGDHILLLALLQTFNIRLYCTDRWEAYRRLLPSELHLMTKRYTQSIERQNLNFSELD